MNQERIFAIKSEEDFNKMAIEVFKFQYNNTLIYKQFVDLLNKNPLHIKHYSEIPFLPISFFKTHKVFHQNLEPEHYFQSSGTTQQIRSKHYFETPDLYLKSLQLGFEQFVGNPREMAILALLPHYSENPHSSLIFMLKELIQQSHYAESGFYLNEVANLKKNLQQLTQSKIPTVLFGVSFALLDLVEHEELDYSHLTIIETGGMKGRREELTKKEVLHLLKKGFPNAVVGSEYGMTELFSQSYALDSLYYKTPPWMRVLLRQLEDPQSLVQGPKNGGINIIDLANWNSCSFIATEDVGSKNENGEFEILGRMDHSEMRGCSLLLN